jgi:isopenicillin N synthase-like dioxygenase
MVWLPASLIVSVYFLVHRTIGLPSRGGNSLTTSIIKMEGSESTLPSIIPLIALPETTSEDSSALTTNVAGHDPSKSVVQALQSSGFLLVTSHHLPLTLQEQAIHAASNVLNDKTKDAVITHPTDPKRYMMLESLEQIPTKVASSDCDEQDAIQVIQTYWNALEQVKRQVLRCVAIGLELPDDYFVNLHQHNHSALRLLHYPAAGSKQNKMEADNTKQNTINTDVAEPSIRCKPHSDYGSITLLLTDGVPGLQAFVNGEWVAVPYVQGALVVNIGSLLSDWTNGQLLATLHRVVSLDEGNTATLPRTSLAFFADPDPDVSATLKEENEDEGKVSAEERVHSSNRMSVAEYIQWRSGGSDRERSGVAFTTGEEQRAKQANKRTG